MRIVLTNCPKDAAAGIADDLVERRLAACVNALPITSTYRWEGATCHDEEVTLLLKVAEEAVAAAKARIVELHPYELPEILVLPVDSEASLAPYVAWVRGEARGGERPDRRRIGEARSRAVAFLLARLRPDGSFGPDAPELVAHYRAPAALAAAGWADAAQLVLDHVARTFQTSEGCVQADRGQDGARDEVWALSNAWLATAAWRVGRYEMATAILRSLSRSTDPGGGTRLEDRGRTVTDLRATANVGAALLAAGRVEQAAAAGRFVAALVDEQPEGGPLHLRRDAEGRLITSFEDGSAYVHVVRPGAPRQAWLVVGHALGFLVQLARATGDASLRGPAGRLLGLLRQAPGLHRDPTAIKAAWGAALWAQDAGDPQALALAGRIAAWQVEAQAPDGGWSPEARLQDRLQRTADECAWLGEIAAATPDA